MLIEVADNGRVLQTKVDGSVDDWVDNPTIVYPFASSRAHIEYRLKPKVTYYRVYLNLITSEFDTLVQGSTFPSKENMNGDCEWIHDFEIES